MNIIHIEDEPWDSGMAHYAVTLGAEQARRGHKVSVWGHVNSPILTEAARLGLGVRSWHNAAVELFALRRDMKAFAPAVLNAHTGSSHFLALALAPRRCAIVRTRADARAPRSNVFTRLVARRTHSFIAANSFIYSQLGELFRASRVRLVPQGIFGPPGPTSPLPPAPVAGVLARLDLVKGHDTILDAAAELKDKIPNLRVLCAGEGPLRDRLSWQLKPLGLDQTVQLLGLVPDRWAFIASCRIGIVASNNSEAVSRAALEWMACGRPLIATRVGGLPDLVEDGRTGCLIGPNDGKALAKALDALIADPMKAAAMGRAGRERWEKLFSPAPFYAATQKVYEEAIAGLPR